MDEYQMLVGEWTMSLRAQRKSPKTIRSYTDTAAQFHDFLVGSVQPTDVQSITRTHVEAYIVDVLERRSEATAATRYRCLQQFFRFLEENEEIERSPMATMRPPKIPDKGTRVLTDAELSSLLATCTGTSFNDRRDQAILRLFISTGARRAEIMNLRLDDVDLERQMVRVMGKGSKVRVCVFGSKTGLALSRYLRARARHAHAASPALWLGLRGPLDDTGIVRLIKKRAEQAGLDGIHPHLFRHTAAHTWLAAGGAEGDLMRLAGWSSREMLDRYARSSAAERAQDAHRRLGLDDRV
jgi:site-specific recombinase XerD